MQKSKKMNFSIIQPNISAKTISANARELWREINKVSNRKTDVVLLPETFLGGPRLKAERKKNALLYADFIMQAQNLCRTKKIHLIGSVIEKSDRYYYNTLIWIDRSGKIAGTYRKCHLFRFYNEHRLFSPGRDASVFFIDGVCVAPNICYDLRFPELMRSQAFAGAHLAIVCAQWPASRRMHWEALLKARAIENQIFIVACNRIGMNHRGDKFAGASQVITPWGDVEYLMTARQKNGSHTIDLSRVLHTRKNYPFLKDSIFHVRKNK